MVTAADGMHPTGMHSCWMKYLPPATFGNMFSQKCVIPSVHKGEYPSMQWAVGVPQHAMDRRVCIPACNGHGGVPRGGCLLRCVYTPPTEMTIEAGGTHPTGMHSCDSSDQVVVSILLCFRFVQLDRIH